jgi:hypothetical protein
MLKTETDQARSFLELLILENTSIIRQSLKHFDGKNTDLLCQAYDKKDTRFADYQDCYCTEQAKELLFKTAYIQQSLKPNSDNNTDIKENDAGILVKNIAKIVGYSIDEKEEGGLLLFKYQNLKGDELKQNNESNYAVLGYAGDTTLKDYFDGYRDINDFNQSQTIKMLEGFEFLREKDSEKEEGSKYEWTNYTLYKKDKKWYGQENTETETEDKDRVEIKKLADANQAKRILFIRIAEQEIQFDSETELSSTMQEKKSNTGSAVFVFYDNQEFNDNDKFSIHRVRYIHVLRNEMINYFNRRYNTDTFRAWIKQREKNDYAFALNHGISTYQGYLQKILSPTHASDLSENAETLVDYLITKLHLVSVLSSFSENKYISKKNIKTEIDSQYKYVLSLPLTATATKLTQNIIDKVVEIEYVNFDDLHTQYEFPSSNIDDVSSSSGVLKDIVFEILNNIKKHGIGSQQYDNHNKMRITVGIETSEDGTTFLSVANTFKGDLDKIDNDENEKKLAIQNGEETKKHGIDLLKKMWRNHNLGEIKIIKPTKETPIFKIMFQLKPLNNKK